ncbi:hypothetical protein K440DRAFT_278433 [Wilcoxina mikolae CBS 423.85]|nr:hypothetical protein K440DRAFT_278433 [Wilcoxina mikolae CBS 423.85]
MVWVNGLNQNMSEHALIEGLRQFGTVVSCVRKNDGKSPNGSQYAFIRYTSPQEAQYAISVGEVDIHGCRVMIKSRNTSRAQRHNSHGSSDYKPYDRSGQPVLGMINRNNHGPSAAFDGNSDPQHGSGQRSRVSSGGPPVLMSKALIVSNLPQDMCPKGFYTLFSEVGPVDGCYIFPHLDHAGRRFGHIVMTSFYMAQKSVEMFHGRSVHGCILDVRYLKSVPTSPEPEPLPMVSPPPGMPLGPHQSRVIFNPPSPPSQPFYHQPQPPLPMGWPQQPAMGNFSPGNYGVPPPFGIPPPPPMLPVLNGQGHVFNQPAVGFPGYTSPPLPQMSPSPIPEMRWSVTPERKQFPNNRQHRRYPAPPPGLGGATPYPRAFSSGSPSDIQTRSISNTNSNVNVESSLPPVERSNKQEYENRSPEQHNSGLVAGVGDTGREIPPNTATVSPVPFEIINAPVIPETSKPVDPCNLFVKNLDDGIISTSEDLKGIFEPFGPVASAHLATFNESKISKGFGFVAFTKPEDAAKAKEKINNSLVGKKRVFVSYAERKEDRAKRLKSLFSGSSTNPEDEEVSNGAKDKEEIINVADPKELSQPKDEEQVSSTAKELSGALSPASGSKDQASSATVPELSPADLDKNNTTPVASAVSPPLGEVHVQNGEGSQSGDKQNGPLGTTEGSTNIAEPGQAAKAEEERLSEPQNPGGKSTNNRFDTNDFKATSEEDLVHDTSNTTPDSLQTRPKNLPPSADVVIKGQLATKVGTGGNKRSFKKGLGSLKVSGTQVQVAVPNIRNSNSLGHASSRIPVQNKNANLPTNSSVGPRLNIDASQNPSPSNTIPSKKRRYKGNRGNGRNSDRIGNDGVSSQKNLVDKQDVGKSVAGQELRVSVGACIILHVVE